MDGRDQIVQLGKILRAEFDNNCDDTAAPDGMDRYLTDWRLEANGALKHTQVQQALELLAGYGVFDATTRRARVGVALEGLRELFRGQGAGDGGQAAAKDPREPEKAVRSKATRTPTPNPSPPPHDRPLTAVP